MTATTAAKAHSAFGVAMDTFTTIKVISNQPGEDVRGKIEEALGWFGHVESICSRFDAQSELHQLCSRQGAAPTRVSQLLLKAVAFALQVAEATQGAFDPTVGAAMARRGFNRNYVTGEPVEMVKTAVGPATFRDVVVDEEANTIAFRKPLMLDLGAVAKGLAIDLAAQSLASFGSYSVEAGGDIYVKGLNEQSEPWKIGIRDPLAPDQLLLTVSLSDAAICTSGDYERKLAGNGAESHLLDPRTGRSPRSVAGASVIAPTAALADALSTAVMVAGPTRGVELLESQGVEGLIVTPEGERVMTSGFGRQVS